MKIAKAQSINNTSFTAHKISKERAEYFDSEFKKAKKIDILTHESTDRDGANSALVLSDYLESLGVQSRVIVSQKNMADLGLKLKNQNVVQLEDVDTKDADALICVDFSKRDRIPEELFDYLINTDKVYCFDHHSNPDIGELLQKDYTLIKKINGRPDMSIDEKINNGDDPNPITPIYVDTAAKSAAGIVYRYLEALGKPLDKTQAYNLFSGFTDDTQKRGMLKCDGEKGTITPNKKLIEDKNSYEIFNRLKAMLDDDETAQIAKNIDVLASLSQKEKEFRDSLYQRLSLSDNGKIAYVEIPPDDSDWLELGMDNARTSTIMNRFRQNVLKNNFNDERLNDVETVITFYRASDVYRMSLHSKKESLLDFFKYVEDKKIPGFTQNSGGHQSRAGGKTNSIEPQACHGWVKAIVSCDDFYA